MFTSLGAVVARHARATVVLWAAALTALAALAMFGAGGEGLFDRLHSGEPRVAGSESDAANDLIDEHRQVGEGLTLAMVDVDLTDPSAVATQMNAFHSRVLAIEGVENVHDPFVFPDGLTDPAARGLLATGSDGFLVQVNLARDLPPEVEAQAHAQAVAELEGLVDDLGGNGVVSSTAMMVAEVTDQIQRDLQTGEAVALPISLLIMVVVFGGFLAAGMPLLGAVASIIGGLGALWGFSYVLDLDAVVVNVATILGLGLSIDYGLLIVSRYREELRAVLDREATRPERRRRPYRDPVILEAISATVGTAGRTVAFSAVTVAVSVAGLLLFDLEILRSLGAAGVSVVLIALLSALTLIPAALTLLGRRMAQPSILRRIPGLHRALEKFGDVPPRQGVFSRLATIMQRRPLLAVLGSLLILGFLASPIANLQMRNSTTELLPQGSDQQQFLTIVEEDFPAARYPAITVVTEAGRADDFSADIARIDGVDSVDPAQEVGSGWVTVGVRIGADDAGGQEATRVVREIRSLHEDGPQFWVTGQAANQIDFADALKRGVAWAAGVVVLATLVLLFLMTGSILVPIKALLINVVSLGASLGITSWIFGDGHLSHLLNFTSAGGLESYVVAVVIAFGFGLAMDYEVFLLARIKEIHDQGQDNNASVRDGLQRSGRIITSAALVIIVVFAGFIAGDLLAIKQVGVALAVTVAIDATLVRVMLVPATMTLLGEWNWWAPKVLRRLHNRFAIPH